MSLYVFSMAVLSIIFMIIFGVWWDGNAPFKIHLAALAAAMATLLSGVLLIAVYPIIGSRPASQLRRNHLDNIAWGSDVSNKLSTPAAVLDGYDVVFANKFFLAELGMPGMSEQVIGMPFSNLVHPGDHLNLAKFIAATVRDSHHNETIALRMLCADGTTIPVHMSLSPLQESGKSNLHLLQFTVLSSHRAASRDAPAQYDYHLLIDRIEQVVFQINADRELIFLNPSWETLLDHAVKDSLTKPLLSFIHPEDRPLVEARLNSLTQGKRNSCHIETRLIARNGNSYWVELRAQAISSLKGERSSVIGTLTDISRMKRTEASLRANRRSLSMLLSNIPGMVYRCKNDRNWSFEFASDGCLEVTGYEPYEMVSGPNFSYIQIIHPDDRVFAWDHVQQQVAKQQKFQLIYRIITRAGHVKWVWEQGKGVFSSTGELLALEGFITDIANDADTDMLMAFQRLFAEQNLA